MFPIPCACSEPSQHFLLYLLPSAHKQPLLVPLGEVLLGVFHFSYYLFLGDLGCLLGRRSKSPVYLGFCGLPFLTRYKYAFTLACAQAEGDLIFGECETLNAPKPL